MQRRTPPDPRATDYFRLSGRSAVLAAERVHRYCRQTRQRLPYGLAARGRTRDLARAHRLSSTLDTGTVWVNTYRAMSPMSPRAGFKHSGLGIEHGTEAVREYTRLKSVWINTDESAARDPFVLGC